MIVQGGGEVLEAGHFLAFREQAVLVAVALWQAQFQRTETPEATSTNLCLLSPGLLKNDGNLATYLVWEVQLRLGCKDCPVSQSREYYYVDAHSGELREQIDGIQYLYRKSGVVYVLVKPCGCQRLPSWPP